MNRISVVIPCLDEAAILVEALQALQPLRQAGHELILVDGGSCDGSPGLARPLVDRVLCTERGRGRQLNSGAQEARHAILWFLHLDTRLPAGAAEELQRALALAPGWGRFDVRLSGGQRLLRLGGSATHATSNFTSSRPASCSGRWAGSRRPR